MDHADAQHGAGDPEQAGRFAATRAPAVRQSLADIARLFLKLGTISFGGPAVHIAMMEDEVVRRRGWISREEFLDYLGATNLIPGPNSTEMAIHIGLRAGGWPGLFVAGTCFILPATCIVAGIAWAYVRFGSLPVASAIFYGVKPVVIAVVLQALWRLARSAVKSVPLAVLGLAALIATATGLNELMVLAAGGVLMALVGALGTRSGSGILPVLAPIISGRPDATDAGGTGVLIASSAAAGAGAVAAFGLWPLFAVFVKVGALLFGSGYVLLAFLRADLVTRLGWLSEQQLLDAVAVGQITPGPVFTTATFVGYVLGRASGAAVATLGIFLPAFLFVALSGPLLPRLRRSRTAASVLDGVNVASLALMAVVTWQLGRAALVDPVTIVLGLVSVIALIRFEVKSAWLMLAGAVTGLVAGPYSHLGGPL